MPMSADAIDRTNPVGMYHYAHSYAASALALDNLNIKATHPDAPVRFLLSHSIELFLKAHLLIKGVLLSILSSREFGHNLEALMRESIIQGLQISELHQQQIAFTDDALLDRYIQTGTRTILPSKALAGICKVLNAEVGKIVYLENGFARNPPSL